MARLGHGAGSARQQLAGVALCLVLSASACSLLAPSDAELRGGEVSFGGTEPTGSASGGSAGEGGTPNAGAAGSEENAGTSDLIAGSGGSDPGQAGVIPFPGGDAGAPPGSGSATSVVDPHQLLWLRADAGVTLTAGLVTAWQDQSGHRNDASQTTATRSPKRVTPVAGKLPWLEFDGVDDELDLPAGFANFDQGLSLFAAVQETVVSSCPAVIQLSNAPDVDDIDLDFDSVRTNQGGITPQVVVGPGTSASDTGRTIHFEAGSQFVNAPGDSFQPGTLVTLSVVQAPSGVVELRIDGVYLARGQVALPKSIERMNNFIGRSLYTGCKALHGRVGELMLYNRAVSEGERIGVEQYLIKRWK